MNRHRRRNSSSARNNNSSDVTGDVTAPVAVPSFNNRRNNSQDSLETMRALEQLRLGENQSVLSNGSSDNLALLINLDEILGNMSSINSTPHPSRLQTPALSETDPGTEVEVRFEDLGTFDIQGVNWNNFAVSRDDYRSLRLREYREFERNRLNSDELAITPEGDDPNRQMITSPLGPVMSFRYMNKVDAVHVPHFQLRHLLCAPTIRTVIFPHFQRIKAWNPVTNQSEIILNTAEFGSAFSKTSVIAATDEHVFVGGFSGELVYKSLHLEAQPARLKSYSTDPNCITNHLFPLPRDHKLLISCNDATLRMFDLQSGKIRSLARFPYAINASEVSPVEDMMACVGDSRKVRLLDYRTCEEIASLQGHSDYLFSCCWSPCGRFVVSGGQDHTALIFDVRKPGKPLHRLASQMAAIRRVTFSPDGQILAVMEADDYVSLYSHGSGFQEAQVIDFFGEVSGISFDPSGSSLYIGCAGLENGGIMEFRR